MEFIVPKFINREPKIMGPFTFKQVVYIAIPGAISLVLYFKMGKTNMTLFIFITAVLLLIGLALGFIKIKGHSLPIVIKNFFVFSVSSKVFTWRRRIMAPKMQKVEKMEQKAGGQQLKIAERSNLQKISVDLETRKK